MADVNARTPRKPSRAVTRPCVTCRRKFTPTRSDQRYCSGGCRQRAHRARGKLDPLDREIEAARLRYWALLAAKAEAHGVNVSQGVTDEAQLVDAEGNVWTGWGAASGGRLIGRTTPHRPGWAAWGLEAAGPPWSSPPWSQSTGRNT